MPKQMHLSKDFFVNAPEEEARHHILELPNCVSNIKFVEENPVRHSMRFIYERPAETSGEFNYIEVSLLPLNVHQTRITLHGSYVDESLFHKDFKITNALCNFESAINAVLKGAINEYEPQQIKINNSRGIRFLLALAGIGCVAFVIKNWFV